MKRLWIFIAFAFLLSSSGGADDRRPNVSQIYHFLPYQKLLMQKRLRSLPITLQRPMTDQEIRRDSERAAPAFGEGKIYCGTQWGYLVALDLETLAEEWIAPLDGSILSAPVYHDGSVYIGTRGGTLYALNAATGEIRWSFSATAPLLSPPLVVEGEIYLLSSNDIVYSLERNTGKRLWHWHRGMTRPISIFASSTPVLYKNFVIVGLSEGYVLALDRKSGELVWQADLQGGGGRFKDVDANPILHQGRVYVPSFGGALYSIDALNGEIQWLVGEGSASGGAIDGGNIYYGTGKGGLRVVDHASGQIVQKLPLSEGSSLGNPVVVGDHLFISSSSGQLFALNKKGLDLEWSIDVGGRSGFLGGLIYHDGYLYALSGHSKLYKVSTTSWKIPSSRGKTQGGHHPPFLANPRERNK